MKIIKNLFKTIEQRNKLDLITELLIVGNSTEDVLSLFNKVKANLLLEMKKRERQNSFECRLINEFDRKETKVYDQNFNKKLSEIETDFEIITPK